jgi:hypothetical protein
MRSAWETFYVIVGSSGGALIGLQFVVVTLIADKRPRLTTDALNAFATPTVVHLTVALVVSAIMNVPWPTVLPLSIALATCGVAGIAYGLAIVLRTRRQTVYVPVWQDWLWYALLPCTAYAALAVAAAFMAAGRHPALFMIAAAALGLLLISIHNAWDTVTHIAMGIQRRSDEGSMDGSSGFTSSSHVCSHAEQRNVARRRRGMVRNASGDLQDGHWRRSRLSGVKIANLLGHLRASGLLREAAAG